MPTGTARQLHMITTRFAELWQSGWPPNAEFMRTHGLGLALFLAVPSLVLSAQQLRGAAESEEERVALGREAEKNLRNLHELICDEAQYAAAHPERFWGGVEDVHSLPFVELYRPKLLAYVAQGGPAVPRSKRRKEVHSDSDFEGDGNDYEDGYGFWEDEDGEERSLVELRRRCDSPSTRVDETTCGHCGYSSLTTAVVAEDSAEADERRVGDDNSVPLELRQILPTLQPVALLHQNHPLAVDGTALAVCACVRELREVHAETTSAVPKEQYKDGTELASLVDQAEAFEAELRHVVYPWSLRSVLWTPVDVLGGRNRQRPDAAGKKLLRAGLVALDSALRVARRWAARRRRSRYAKALALYVRLCGRTEFPYVALSALLDVLSGTLVPLRTSLRVGLINEIVSVTRNGGNGAALRAKLEEMGSSRIMCKLQGLVFAAILKQDLAYFDVHGSRWTSGVMQAAGWDLRGLLELPTRLLAKVAQLASTLTLLWRTNSSLFSVSVAALGVPTLFSLFCRMVEAKARSAMYQVQEARNGDEQWDWFEIVQPRQLATSRANNREPLELAKYKRGVLAEARIDTRSALITSLFEPPRELAMQAGRILSLWAGGAFTMEGDLDPGSLTQFAGQTEDLLEELHSLYRLLRRADSSLMDKALKIYDLLSLQPLIGLNDGLRPPGKLRGEIEFRNVRFRYPTRKGAIVAKDYTFKVEAGSQVGVCGPSGCGKSTLVKLLLRMYDPDSGTITVDGMDTRTLEPLWLREQCSLVEQEPTLFDKSIRENIIFGAEGALSALPPEEQDRRLTEACAMANCLACFTDKRKFPEAMRTVLGGRDARIAGGEKQRLAIARALLRDPQILLLDEPTASLDAESETLVTEALERLMKGRTTIIIAHRLKTLTNCDQLLFIENGVIAESGTYATLAAKKGGRFASFLRQQRLVEPGNVHGSEEGMPTLIDSTPSRRTRCPLTTSSAPPAHGPHATNCRAGHQFPRERRSVDATEGAAGYSGPPIHWRGFSEAQDPQPTLADEWQLGLLAARLLQFSKERNANGARVMANLGQDIGNQQNDGGVCAASERSTQLADNDLVWLRNRLDQLCAEIAEREGHGVDSNRGSDDSASRGHR